MSTKSPTDQPPYRLCKACRSGFLPRTPDERPPLLPGGEDLCRRCELDRESAAIRSGELRTSTERLLSGVKVGPFRDSCVRLLAAPPVTDEQSAEYDRKKAEKELRRRCPLLGVPAKFKDATLDTADQMRPAILEVLHYLEFEHAQGKCLVLSGETQAGKTFAAVCALHEIRHQRRAFYVFSAIVDDYAFKTRENEDFRRAIFETPFVVLDDIGSECGYATGTIQERFAERIIFEREQRVLPTIITTNLDPEGFGVRVGRRAAARINEGWGRFVVVERPRK